MLVNELKQELKKYKSEEKDKIIVELYKKIPKSIKEDYDIDNFIINLNDIKLKENKSLSIDELNKQVTYFIECASSRLYAQPNRIINKKERSNWRFKAKRFYKELNSFLPNTKDGLIATYLLTKLYYLLSYGTNYLTFSSFNTFGALGVRQSEYLENIMKRKLILGAKEEIMKDCVNLIDTYYDPEISHIDMIYTFVSCLNTIDLKNMAIKVIEEKILDKKSKMSDKKSFNYNYELETMINYLTECALIIFIALYEVDNGIKFFHKYYIEKYIEVKEYILLEFLELEEKYDYWIKEYEKNMDKINYRDSLKEKYNEYKKGNYEYSVN